MFKTYQKLFLLVFTALMLSSCTTTFYLVRHAEKGSGSDPDLTAAGHQRAIALCDSLRDKGIDYIYTTNYKRTQQTAAPTATVTGKNPQVITANDTPELVRRLRGHTLNHQILVVGHSNTIPVIIDSLMRSPQNITIQENDFDNLFKVKISRGNNTTRRLYRETYGVPSP